jgi:hypothetical protein
MRRIELALAPHRSTYGWSREAPVLGTDAIVLGSNEDFLNTVLNSPRRLHYASRTKYHTVGGYGFGETGASLAVQTVHNCYDRHIGLRLSPDVLWYMIVSEVATHVKANAGQYASLFTQTPGAKQLIEVRDDSLRYDGPSDWGHTIELFRDPLRAAVTDRTMGLFLPSFSTASVEAETALLVCFMDAASPYYEYRASTMCGIPAIELEGTNEDWRTLLAGAEALVGEFPTLAAYFGDLLPVVAEIVDTATGGQVDENFWRSLYKQEGGSGGPYINGWINALFAHIRTPEGLVPKDDYYGHSMFDWRKVRTHTDMFPAHLSQVPFVWNYFGAKYDMAFAGGVLGVDHVGDTLQPQLGFAVVEV